MSKEMMACVYVCALSILLNCGGCKKESTADPPASVPYSGVGVRLVAWNPGHSNNAGACFSFRYASQDTSVTGFWWDIGYRQTAGLWCLIYVKMAPYTWSLICDLGAVPIESVTSTRQLGANWRDTCRAFLSHVYVVHTVDPQVDFYTRVLVTEVSPAGGITDGVIKFDWVRSRDGITF